MLSTKTGFVIMPFSPTKSETDWTEIYTEVFQPALTECGYSCSRAEVSTGNLVTSIVEQLVEADIVIVDVTDQNANVFYELGVRHSLRRGTIIVSQATEHVPSDLKGYWFITYGIRPGLVKAFKADIKRVIELFERDPLRSDNPVSDFLDKAHRSSIRETNRDNLKKLGALITELSGNRLAIKQQIATRRQQLFSVGCIQLLMQTLYLDVGPEVLKRAHQLEYHLEILRGGGEKSNALLASTLIELDAFAHDITDIREGVAKGEFSEPTTVSMMTWSPVENQPSESPDDRDQSVVAAHIATYESAEDERTEEDRRAESMERSRMQQLARELNYSEPAPTQCVCGHLVRWDESFCKVCGQAVR